MVFFLTLYVCMIGDTVNFRGENFKVPNVHFSIIQQLSSLKIRTPPHPLCPSFSLQSSILSHSVPSTPSSDLTPTFSQGSSLTYPHRERGWSPTLSSWFWHIGESCKGIHELHVLPLPSYTKYYTQWLCSNNTIQDTIPYSLDSVSVVM